MDSSATKIIKYGEKERIQELKNAISDSIEIPEEELVEAYNAATNIKEVKTRMHTSSCKVIVGKLSKIKANVSDRERDFLNNCSNSSAFNMFPVQQKKLDSIMTKLHIKEKTCSIGDSSLMDLKTFEDKFLPYIQKLQDEVDEIKGEISNSFDERYNEFERETLSIVGKIFPEKLKDVENQLEYIKKRGRDGYLDKISIEVSTKFGMDEVEDFDENLKDFLKKCKKVSAQRQANEIITSMLSSLWQAGLSYLINITKEDAGISLEGSKATRTNLLERAQKVRREAKPFEAVGGGQDIVLLAKKLESLSMQMDRYRATEEGFDIMVEIYLIARVHYGYMLDFKVTQAKIPDWLLLEDIVAEAEDLMKAM